MRRVGGGDDEAFRVLVERHQHAVLGTIAKMLGSHSVAEDLAQEVFLRVWKSASRYRPEAKFLTWLMTITRNLVFNECRRTRRSRLVAMEDLGGGSGAGWEASDVRQPSPAENVQEEELRLAIERALAGLPEKARLAVVLRRYEELSYEEIATVLETSVPAVKSLLFRARNDLRASLSGYLQIEKGAPAPPSR